MAAIPVYVISFNQPTYLRNMVRQLCDLRVDRQDIHVVDNGSDLPEVLDYLREIETQGCRVHRISTNLGPLVAFDPRARLDLPGTFALTDPDLQFHSEMPHTFRSDLAEIGRWCGTWKCGCALTIDDADQFMPGPYHLGRTIHDWESSFWKDAVTGGPPPGSVSGAGVGEGIYRAPIDTTFAVYMQDIRHDGFFEAVRVAGRYQARHLPWYARSFASPIPGESSPEAPLRLADGRVMVRPSPHELDHYRRQARGSTIVGMLAADDRRGYLDVVRPEDGYAFGIASGTAHAAWWSGQFATGWRAPTFRILREHLSSSRGPTRLLDIGASIGRIALWSALRCEHVYCVEPDPAAVDELRQNIAVNRLEHGITVVPRALCQRDDQRDHQYDHQREHLRDHLREDDGMVPGISLETLCRAYGVPLDTGNLFVSCDIGGAEEHVLEDLLSLAATKPEVVGGVLVAMHRPRWTTPAFLASCLAKSYARHPALGGWRVSSGDLQPLHGLEGIIRYVDEVPLGSVLWAGPGQADIH